MKFIYIYGHVIIEKYDKSRIVIDCELLSFLAETGIEQECSLGKYVHLCCNAMPYFHAQHPFGTKLPPVIFRTSKQMVSHEMPQNNFCGRQTDEVTSVRQNWKKHKKRGEGA